jgi:glycyl-tRNA synthetase beta chain
VSGAGAGRTFLLEIGTEEIPARMVDGAARDLGDRILALAERSGLIPGSAERARGGLRTYGTPRRLAVSLAGVRDRQPDGSAEVAGPPVRAAFDAEGRPTPAAIGFARAQGVRVEDLVRLTTARGECVGARRTVHGKPAAEVLAAEVPPLVLGMTFPKTMRWGNGDTVFVRPIHWIVALLDDRVIDLEIAGVRSGRTSRGHRLAGTAAIELPGADAYVDRLRNGLVIADARERRAAIEAGLGGAAREAGGAIAAPPGGVAGDPELVEEVTQLVEWPLVIRGEFDAAFLALPAEILITAMRHHQKSFALRALDGGLLGRFLAVANVREDRRGLIRKGHEWVLRARLTDARFFWEEDRHQSLEAHAAGLERLMFHEKLGSYARKAERLVQLAGAIAPAFEAAGTPIDHAAVRDAARLCKADLCTQMVKEFPEGEGIVGGLYARADGLTARVADAIYTHYLPRGADDPLPASPEAAILSLADRLDTQAGIFLLGLVPSGSRDPYGLRRSVLGACRLLMERRVRVSLQDLLDRALAGYAGLAIEGAVPAAEARGALLEFYRGRMEHLGETAGLRTDSVRAALAASVDDPGDARLRMEALETIRTDPGFAVLVQAHKRIKNIVKGQAPQTYDRKVLREPAERALGAGLEEALPEIARLQARQDHLGALRAIARLAGPLDRFFADVMVLVDDRRLRDNRLALLQSIGDLFLRIGDFSAIVVERAPAETGPARRGA